MQNLRTAISQSVTADDLQAMVQVQVDKAKAGDSKAAKFVLDMLGMNQPIHLTQNNYYDGDQKESGGRPKSEAPELRHKIFALLEKSDGMTAGQIAARFQIDEASVLRELKDAGLFSRRGQTWFVDTKV